MLTCTGASQKLKVSKTKEKWRGNRALTTMTHGAAAPTMSASIPNNFWKQAQH